MTSNGRLVHIATADGHLVCRSDCGDLYRFRARITCEACIRKRPAIARRWASRPLVTERDLRERHEALYRVVRAALGIAENDVRSAI